MPSNELYHASRHIGFLLPVMSVLYTLHNEYYMACLILLMQLFIGLEYFNRQTNSAKYIYAVHAVLVIPYYILVAQISIYKNWYMNVVYICSVIHITASFLQIKYTYFALYLYIVVHYIGNIATFIMLTGLPKIRIEYFIKSTGERIIF
jgi:hypothetical protein